jgi:hypothetical protein
MIEMPFACPSVLMKVPSIVPSAAAERVEVSITKNNAKGDLPQLIFITKVPKV